MAEERRGEAGGGASAVHTRKALAGPGKGHEGPKQALCFPVCVLPLGQVVWILVHVTLPSDSAFCLHISESLTDQDRLELEIGKRKPSFLPQSPLFWVFLAR